MVKSGVKEPKTEKGLIRGKDPNHFWCYIDMADEPLEVQSLDPRYCQNVYNLLAEEIEVLAERHRVNKKVWWYPKGYVVKTVIPRENEKQVATAVPNSAETQRVGVTEPCQNSIKGNYTPNNVSKPKNGVVLAHPGGRSKKEIPERLIKQLAAKHMGHRKIAAVLREEHCIKIADRTVARILAGQRALL